MHAGIDIGSSKSSREDEPIYAVKGGTVTLVARNEPQSPMSGYGNAVVIRHEGGKYALYAHLKDGSVTVAPGQTVTGGQRIGSMGNTTNGQFSPLPGESVEVWQRRARARGYRSGPMIRHLHFELRRALPDGSSPFPGPYPTSPSMALQNEDPGPWFRELGLSYSPRGAAVITPGSSVDQSRHLWSGGMSGTLAVMGLDGLGQGYQPPEPERDVRFGLTPMEWAAVAASGVVVTGAIVALVVRRMRRNRR
jgi:murein DD-endopeptidase MepM/ murein hydrolase activator NlpD